MKRIFYLMLVLPIVALSACGGGGGSAATPGGGAYTGATTPAVVTGANANALAGNVVGGAQMGGVLVMTGAVASVSRAPRIARVMPLISKKINDATVAAVANLSPVYGAAVPISASGPCAFSGTFSLTGSVDDVTGTGSLTVTFAQCNDGTGTLNGFLAVAVNAYDVANGVVKNGAVSFNALTFNDGVTTVTMDGSFTDVLNQLTSTRTQTADFVALDSASGWQVKLSNYRMVTVLSPSWVQPTSYTLQISGRVFDGSFGYVDIATTAPLNFVSMIDLYPSSGGPVVLTGAAPSQVTVQPVDAVNVQISGVDGGSNAFGPATVLWSSL